MNEVIKQLYDRKSVRVFEDREISAEDKALILGAAIQAPTAGCQQFYTILDITDQALKEKLARTCDDQPFIAKAKMVLIFLADCSKWFEGFKAAGAEPRTPGAGDLLLACADACIAAQNAVVAAESLGIGSCYIGDILENVEAHRELLKLPPYVVPAAMLVFGYPTQGQKDRPKPERAGIAQVVAENQYPQHTDQTLRSIFEVRTAGRPYEEWMQAFCQRKYNSDFAREMQRSADIYLSDFTHQAHQGDGSSDAEETPGHRGDGSSDA